MKIYIGSDHAGYDLKQSIIKMYNSYEGNDYNDCGC